MGNLFDQIYHDGRKFFSKNHPCPVHKLEIVDFVEIIGP